MSSIFDHEPPDFACLATLMLVAIYAVVGGYCIDYSVEFWLAYAGHPVNVPFFASAIAGALMPRLAACSAALTLLASFAV